MDEIEVINKMQTMCEESCSPDQFAAWENLKAYLMKTRKNLHTAQQKMHPTLGESAASDSESTPAPKRVI